MIQLEVAKFRLCREGDVLTDEEHQHRIDCFRYVHHITSLGYRVDMFDREIAYFERVYYIKFKTEEEAALFKLRYT